MAVFFVRTAIGSGMRDVGAAAGGELVLDAGTAGVTAGADSAGVAVAGSVTEVVGVEVLTSVAGVVGAFPGVAGFADGLPF